MHPDHLRLTAANSMASHPALTLLRSLQDSLLYFNTTHGLIVLPMRGGIYNEALGQGSLQVAETGVCLFIK